MVLATKVGERVQSPVHLRTVRAYTSIGVGWKKGVLSIASSSFWYFTFSSKSCLFRGLDKSEGSLWACSISTGVLPCPTRCSEFLFCSLLYPLLLSMLPILLFLFWIRNPPKWPLLSFRGLGYWARSCHSSCLLWCPPGLILTAAGLWRQERHETSWT